MTVSVFIAWSERQQQMKLRTLRKNGQTGALTRGGARALHLLGPRGRLLELSGRGLCHRKT
jgi:hypothetical protein